jgi:divalent metal cation (Fe/Co/Zn/Cd) transporter
MTFGQIWDLAFNALVVFVGVGILWLRFIESLFPSQQTSVIVMTIVALVAAVARFVLGYRSIRRKLDEAEAQIEATTLQLQEEAE